MWSTREPGARLTIAFSQEMHNMKMKGPTMRVTFTLEIKAEIDSFDTKQREVFVKLMTQAAKGLHTKAVMLSQKVSPNMKVLVGDSSGTEAIDLFVEDK